MTAGLGHVNRCKICTTRVVPKNIQCCSDCHGNPRRHWLLRQRALLDVVATELGRMGFSADELKEIPLKDAAAITLQAAGAYAAAPGARMEEVAASLGLAAESLDSAVSMGGFVYLANQDISLAIQDINSARLALLEILTSDAKLVKQVEKATEKEMEQLDGMLEIFIKPPIE